VRPHTAAAALLPALLRTAAAASPPLLQSAACLACLSAFPACVLRLLLGLPLLWPRSLEQTMPFRRVPQMQEVRLMQVRQAQQVSLASVVEKGAWVVAAGWKVWVAVELQPTMVAVASLLPLCYRAHPAGLWVQPWNHRR